MRRGRSNNAQEKEVAAPNPKRLRESTARKSNLETEQNKEDTKGKVKVVPNSSNNTFQIKDDAVVSKQQTNEAPKSELKIANVFRISENEGDAGESRRKSSRKVIPTEKMRDYEKEKQKDTIKEEVEEGKSVVQETKEKASSAPAPKEKEDKVEPQSTTNLEAKTESVAKPLSAITIKSPNTINNTIVKPGVEGVKFQRVMVKQVNTKDGSLPKVILSSPIAKGSPANEKLVYVKRIMQPMTLKKDGSQPQQQTVTFSPGGTPSKNFTILPYKGLTGLNRESIVIKKVPATKQIKANLNIVGQPPKVVIDKNLTKPQSPGSPNTIQVRISPNKFITSSKPLTKTANNVQSNNKINVQQISENARNFLAGDNQIDKNKIIFQQYEALEKYKAEVNRLTNLLETVLKQTDELKTKMNAIQSTVKSAIESISLPELKEGPVPIEVTKVYSPVQMERQESPNKVFKMQKLPIADSNVLDSFEEDLAYRKFYDLVYTRLANMVPNKQEKRTMEKYLKSLLDESLLSKFVWDSKCKVDAEEGKIEFSKYFHIQSLFFGLINHHKTLNYPNGCKWADMEQFLRNQFKLARDKNSKKESEEQKKNDAEAGSSENVKEKSDTGNPAERRVKRVIRTAGNKVKLVAKPTISSPSVMKSRRVIITKKPPPTMGTQKVQLIKVAPDSVKSVVVTDQKNNKNNVESSVENADIEKDKAAEEKIEAIIEQTPSVNVRVEPIGDIGTDILGI